MTTDTLSDIAHRALPAPIVRAMELAFHHLLCQDLTINARRVLAGILSHIRYDDPTFHVYASHERLIQSAKLNSGPTLRRGLKELADKGYLTRQQMRQLTRVKKICNGLYFHTHIWLTEKALEMVGLVHKGVIQYPDKKVIHIKPTIKVSDRNKKNTPENKTTVIKNNESSFSEIDQETHLPKNLLPLLSIGLIKSQICLLMKLCKGKPFRLEDVIKTCWNNISGATSPLAYLKFMIRKTIDFKYLARAEAEESAAAEACNEDRQTEREFVLRDGWLAVNEDGDWIGTIESNWREGLNPNNCMAYINWAGGPGSEPINRAFISSIRERMQSGELRFVQS